MPEEFMNNLDMMKDRLRYAARTYFFEKANNFIEKNSFINEETWKVAIALVLFQFPTKFDYRKLKTTGAQYIEDEIDFVSEVKMDGEKKKCDIKIKYIFFPFGADKSERIDLDELHKKENIKINSACLGIDITKR